MDKAKYEAALAALTDFIHSELVGSDRARFARIKRLSILAAKLQMEDAKVEDADPMNMLGGDLGEDYGVGVGQLRGGAVFGGDQNQAVREMLQMLGPQFEAQGKASVARERESVAQELNHLLRAKERAQNDAELLTALNDRIKILTKQIAKQEIENADRIPSIQHVHVVPALPLRGHQIGEGECLFDADQHRGAIPDGERGNEGALGVRAEAGGDGEAVGHGG